MVSIKKQFSDLRKNTPKQVQWLLLAAAFVVVLILLTLLLRGGDDTKVVTDTDMTVAHLNIDPDTIDWATTKVGTTQRQRINISATGPVKIATVRLAKDIDGLAAPKTTCTNIGQINENISCTISLEYAPKTPADLAATSLFIDWRGALQPEKMNRTEKIAIALGAVADAPAATVEPKPVTVDAEKITPQIQIKKEIEAIAPSDPFVRPEPVLTETDVTIQEPIAPDTRAAPRPTEACSDFAFPGYNTSGQQIGWIKPDGGRYNFHPFSDKNCATPTGTYNPDSGVIIDINNPSKKIGTDAEHIGQANLAIAGTMPQLSNPIETRTVNKARQLSAEELAQVQPAGKPKKLSELNPNFIPKSDTSMLPSSLDQQATVSSRPYDRTFVLRQYKPIPATIVSEIRAVANETRLPVTATVDRNVYSDNGRTIIIPSGTMMLGSVVGDMPGPYKAIGRISIEWYRFVRPDGVEFNFSGHRRPFSGDAQGRTGVPGRGSTDYMEQFVMPMLTAIVPAAVNLIAPISDKFINQIDLDNNTVTQTGQVRSSELAKNEIISAWNKVAQKLLVDMMDNTVPPFSIATGTRITVFSPNDLIVTCGLGNGKKCAITEYDNRYAPTEEREITVGVTDPSSLIGQVRSFNLDQYCDGKGGVSANAATIQKDGFDYRTIVFYCQSNQYKAINNAKQEAVYKNQNDTGFVNTGMGTADTTGNFVGNQQYNENVLDLKYNEDGTIQNPFKPLPVETPPVITCEDGTVPDANGCCTGETFTDMGEQGSNCCPASGGDCFPPIK